VVPASAAAVAPKAARVLRYFRFMKTPVEFQ
jgi:hypothetical protein